MQDEIYSRSRLGNPPTFVKQGSGERSLNCYLVLVLVLVLALAIVLIIAPAPAPALVLVLVLAVGGEHVFWRTPCAVLGYAAQC